MDNNAIDYEKLLKIIGLTSLANEVDRDVIASYGGETDTEIFINIEKVSTPTYCPNCDSKMYSKGFRVRRVRHPVLYNGKTIIINLKQRKYRCTNKLCNTYINEEFTFVEKYKQISTPIPYLILNDMKDVCLTCAAISRRYHISDTYVHNIIMRYLDFKPLQLSEIISIDEVYLNIDYSSRYVVIIADFITGDIIDVLPNRYDETLRRFFMSYSKEERDKVKYVISDMYQGYLDLPRKYLFKAKGIIDSFHIGQVIEKSIRDYIGKVKKRYKKKLDEERQNNNYQYNKSYKTRKDSVELTLLKRHDWVLLCKPGNEPEISSKHFSRSLGIYPTLERIQKMFLDLDPMFPILKEMKDKYLNFNDEYVGKPEESKEALNDLIIEYKTSNYSIFKEFGALLEKHFNEIVLSFTTIAKENKGEVFYQRLSNGPMEGFNRKPKDMKRMARGFTNFEFVRNRILWASRKDATILAIPKSYKAD